MRTIYYGNTHETSAKYRPIAMYSYTFNKILNSCEGHYGCGGVNKDSYYVNVNDWEKVIKIVNKSIVDGHSVFTLRTTKIKL